MKQGKLLIVEAIIKDSGGRVLLLKRSKKNKFFVGKWQLPGGKVRLGEDVDKAIKREIKEEIGKSCTHLKLKKVLPVFEKLKEFTGSFTFLVFSCKIKGKIALCEDHTECRYFKMSKIKPSTLTPTSKKALFSKQKKKS